MILLVLGHIPGGKREKKEKSIATGAIGIIVAACIGGLMIFIVIIAVIVVVKRRRNKNFEATNKAFEKFDDVS